MIYRLRLSMMAILLLLFLAVLGGCGHPTDEGLVFKTADPNLSVGFRFFPKEAPPVSVEPEVLPEEEVGQTVPEPPLPPPCEEIKGNISKDGRRLYHGRDSPNYDQVKIDKAKGEKFFCTVEEAEAEGFTKAGG